MTSTSKKEREIKVLEAEIYVLHNKMDELEEVSMHLSQKIILAKRQLELIISQQGALNV
jgi:hypothetical protein